MKNDLLNFLMFRIKTNLVVFNVQTVFQSKVYFSRRRVGLNTDRLRISVILLASNDATFSMKCNFSEEELIPLHTCSGKVKFAHGAIQLYLSQTFWVRQTTFWTNGILSGLNNGVLLFTEDRAFNYT